MCYYGSNDVSTKMEYFIRTLHISIPLYQITLYCKNNPIGYVTNQYTAPPPSTSGVYKAMSHCGEEDVVYGDQWDLCYEYCWDYEIEMS